MLFPALDTLRLKANPTTGVSSSSSSTHSYSHSATHNGNASANGARPSHFRTPPIDFIDSRASTPHLLDHSAASTVQLGKAHQDGSQRTLKPQSSFSSLTKVDPFARIGTSLSTSLKPAQRSDRPDSVASFGTDFVTGLLSIPPPRTVEPSPAPSRHPSVKKPSALNKRTTSLRQPSNTSLSSYEAPPDNLLPFPKPSVTPKSVRSTSGRRDIPPVPMVDAKYADYGSVSYKTPATGNGQRYESQRSTTPRLTPRTTSLGTSPGTQNDLSRKPVPPLPSISVEDDYAAEHHDTVPSLPNSAFDFGHNRSISGAARLKGKSDKVLGLDPNTRLCSLFMISGVRKADPSKWIPADRESSTRIQPAEDSMNFFWRPEALNTTFPSDQTEKYEKIVQAGKKARPEHMRALARTPAYTGKTHNVPDAGPDGAEKMMNKALKYAHPKEVEIINSALQPNSTAHYFTFTLPCHTTQARNARDRLERGSNLSREQMRSIDMNADARSALNSAQQERELSSQADITFHGATLTVWVPAEPTTVKQLKAFRAQLARKHQLDQVLQAPVLEEMPESEARGKGKRGNLPWLNNQYTPSMTDLETASEWEGESINIMSDDETRRKPSGRFIGGLGSNTGNSSMLGSAFDQPTDTEIDDTTPRPSMDGGDLTPVAVTGSKSNVFWIPFALTLVSRHPIYETMLDYIRLDWTKFSKDSRMHTYQICKILNAGTPRPGEAIALRIGSQEDADAVTIHARFPGGVDFDKGLIQTDFMLWPLFQAIDADMILTCVEVALSTQGRVIMTSSYPTMLCLCVNILKYMVELRGWHGICLPTIHARDISFIVEDPGPYIVGVPTETRWTVPPPPEVCILNLDENMLHLKRPPLNVVTPRNRREKVKHKIYQALGNDFPIDRTVPKELKVAFLSKRFRTFNKVSHHKPEGSPPPQFLADKVPTPSWWKGGEVLAVFDKIMLDKHKKPSLIQRLTKSGLTRYDAQVTVGEQLAQAMMRRRALHYLESRDNLDDKTAKINQKLMQLMRDGEKHRKQFEVFEKQADYLAQETIRLQSQMEKEQREAQRLSAMNSQQGEMNKNLQSRLKATEDARAQAMRQLSDMQESMQDLEKEREEIMNIIENQINSAIEHLPYGPGEMGSPILSSALSLSDDGASTASIGKARLARRASRSRPTTSASGTSALTTGQDGMSVHSQDKAVSVLGAAKNGSGYKRMSSQTTGTIVGWGKGEVAERMAAIQQKLNLALSSVAEAQRESEELRDDPLDQGDSAAVGQSSAESDSDAQNGALGVTTSASRESSSSTRPEPDTNEGDEAPTPPTVEPIPATGGKAARKLAAVFIPPPPPADDPSSSSPPSAIEPSRPPKSAERGLSAQDLGLVKPGQLRLKPKKENGTSRSGSPASLQLAPNTSNLDIEIDSAVIPPTPAEFGAIGRTTQSMLSTGSIGSNGSASGSNGHLHNMGMTPSLSASTTDDMILSPPSTPGGDRMSLVGSEEGMQRRHSADVKSTGFNKDVAEMKRGSRLSTGTTAFGPI